MRKLPSRCGQAMIEFVVALISVLIVFAGAIQLILLSTADTETMVEATADASDRARSSLSGIGDHADWIRDWENGRDAMEQTKDDQPITGSPIEAQVKIAGRTVPDGDWSALQEAHSTDLQKLHSGAFSMAAFGLVKGDASQEVEVIPVVSSLLGLPEVMEVRNEVWSTITGGL